jgi:hypothetical protein
MPLQPGTKLGPYQILEPIGAGGMGEVHKATDRRRFRTRRRRPATDAKRGRDRPQLDAPAAAELTLMELSVCHGMISPSSAKTLKSSLSQVISEVIPLSRRVAAG